MSWQNDQVSEKETAKILEVARGCLSVSGDFVEMGCYRGDTSILLAEVLQEEENDRQRKATGAGDGAWQGESRRKLWLYDSFEGLPEKGAEDISAAGEEFREGVLAVSKREVKARFLRSGLAVPRMVKRWFSELGPEDLPERIAFSFLDGDFYESTRDCLRLVGPKMVSGGAIVVHDFRNPALPGVEKAVLERFSEEEVEIFESMGIIKMKR